ncbi:MULTISPECIES: antitoxin [Actinomycetes]|uniref:Antitoxin n=2 Tax=Actinomycetes TaxID=1760 RepID=A0A852WEY3_9MICO|nr:MULTISPECIES: antitoxin [Actinomycetes]MBB4689851.1 hypothetical protein [Amycolatopsis jiangsuensis]NYG07787.1 hypothetical protein [Pedococcus badiiscoriae]NYG07793.1 hypothetical protein [Pedococcus badiiscoriae]
MDFNEILDEAKKLAGEHPEQAKAALDKAEGILDERTGGKFADQIKKGGDAVGGQLGLPPETP